MAADVPPSAADRDSQNRTRIDRDTPAESTSHGTAHQF